jgi:hypothetical protein
MKPSLFLRATRLRRKLRFLWCSWFCPNVIVEDLERESLNRELRQHWPERQLRVYELIHEQWDPDDEIEGNAPDDRFIVFIDHELAVDWIKRRNLNPASAKGVSVAEAVGARRCKHLPREQVLELKRLVGQAVVSSIQGNLEEAAATARQASNFLKARTTERSRYWSLLSAHSILGFAVFLLQYFWLQVNAAFDFPSVIGFGVSGGFLGAYLSLLQRAGKGEWDSAAGPWIHLVEIFTKLLAGAILGGVAIAFSGSVHAPPSLKTMASDPSSVFVLGLVAGFVERLIPRLISEYSNNITSENHEEKSDLN